jgi:hypothetical protein
MVPRRQREKAVGGVLAGCLATVFLTVLGFANTATAQERPYNLVCFEQSGLEDSLNKIVNAQQLTRLDRILKSGSCDFAQVPKGSSARFVTVHQTRNGFIFPMFQVRYATSGQRMYVVDGIFKAEDWRVTTKCGRGYQGACIEPRTCPVLDGFMNVSNGFVPDYLRVPRNCRVYKTN